MVSQKVGRILLCIAGTLAMIQSIVNFMGGFFAANDRNVKAYGGWLSDYVGDYKYYCGFISIRNVPMNVREEGAECMESYYEMDSGWFESTHTNCNRRYYEYDSHACELNGWGHIIAFASFTGAGWMTAGVLCIVSAIRANKRGALVALFILGIIYVVAIAIFGLVWSSASKVNRHCLKLACRQVKERGQKSSNRFLVYAISSLVSILIAGVLSFIGYRSLEASLSSNVSDESPRLPPVAQAPALYPAPIPEPSDGIPYGVPVSNQPVFVPTEVVSVGGHAIVCQEKAQCFETKERSVSNIDKDLKGIPLSSEDTHSIKKQAKDKIAAFKSSIKTQGILKANESTNDSTLKGKKSIFEKLASQSLNLSVIKKLLGIAGLIKEIGRKDSAVRQSGDNARGMEGQNSITTENDIYHK